VARLLSVEYLYQTESGTVAPRPQELEESMPTLESAGRQRRRWANVIVILVGLLLVGLTAFGVPVRPRTPTGEIHSLRSLYLAYGISGALALIALFVAYRSRGLARAMLVGAAAVLMVFGFDAFREPIPGLWLTIVVPSLLLLGAAPFFGPMPRAQP
jgi:peptidoglycan/LPS O-acetylase OafA/YrhL